MKRYCVLAWLPPNGEMRVAVNAHEVVCLFDDYHVAWGWAKDELAPDWEFVVLPITVLVVDK